MRLFVALLFLSSQILAKSLEGEPIKFSTETHPNFYEELPGASAPLHSRVKRSVLAALGFTTQCEPGWTGQFCENPICSGNATRYNIPTRSQLIDQLYLPSGCPGKYYIPVDSFAISLTINVHADGIPWINLTDASGNLVPGSGTAMESLGYMVYPATLPPGGYQLTIDNGGVATRDCIVVIETYSTLGAITGFSESPQSDILPNDESATDGEPMYFVTHPLNLTNPGQLRSVTVRSDRSMTPVYRSVLTPRYSCAYELYAGQFTCSKNSIYVAHVDGVDQNGYPFRRSKQFSCVAQLSTTTAATTQPLQTCYNGGTLIRYGQPDVSCFCPELFNGAQCEKPVCMNGGTLMPSGLQCECPDGFWGTNCEHVNCDPNFGPYLTDYKSLVLVVRNTVSMNQYIPQIVAAVNAELMDNDALANGVYQSFLLVKFADDVYLPKYYTAGQYNSFIADLTNLGKSTIVGNCSDTTFDAIYDVFTQMIYDKSPIFLFTDAIASDADNWRSVTESNSRRKLPIYSYFFPQSNCNFDELNQGYQAIQRAAMYSGGLSFLVRNTAGLTTFFTYAMRGTTSKMNQVYANDLDKCTANVQRSFMVDSSAQDIIVFVTGGNAQLQVTNPSWSPNVQLQIYGDGLNYVYEIVGVQPGEYIFSISTANPQAPCSIRIMARSDYDLFFATTLAAYFDAIDSEPVVGQPVHLVAQLNGLYNATRDPYRLFSELTITTNRNRDQVAGKPMYYSNGQYRDGCGYHLYFGVADFCEFPDQPFYATVFADDNQGYTIQRTTIGYCSLSITTVAPPGSCLNGGVMDPEHNTTCICPAGFIGDHCQQIVCQNGGTPAGSFCICNAGSSGTFCELYTCPLANVYPASSFERQTMVFVVAARPSMQTTWNMLASSVGNFVRDAQDHSATWIKSWVLITVNADGSEAVVNDISGQTFVDGVKAVATNLSAYSSTNDTGCNVDLMSGLLYGTYLSEKRSSIYLFTDTTGPDTQDFLKIFSLTTEHQITINIIQTNSTSCTPDGKLNDYIQDLAYMTNGFFYITSNIPQILPYITSMYMSGVSGQVFYVDDCSKTPAEGYVAIDGWTQSFTVAAIGDSIASVDVYMPDGTNAANTFFEIDLIADSTLNLKQFMAACPSSPGWNYKDQYCYSFFAETLSWYNASIKCHSQNAALVDILDEDTDQYVKRQTNGMNNWIGLTRILGKWFWDVPDGNHQQPLDPNYTKWCPGYPTNDQGTDCVAMDDTTGCWMNMDCTQKLPYTCQKHRYGQGLYPGDPGNNVVPAGRWRVEVKTNSGNCYAQIRSQSEIQTFFGFVQDPRDDFPSLFANADPSTNYVVVNPTNLSPFQSDVYPAMEGNLNYAIIGYNSTLTNPLTISNRPFCGYPYISQPFVCPQPGSGTNFFIQFSGIDQFGYSFDRYVDSNCYKYVLRCDNGGYINNGLCVCQPGFTGSKCSTPICQNGGEDVGGVCKCPPMFSGTFCEQPFCEPPVPTTFATKGRTLAILLETSYNMGSTISLMKRNLKSALDSIKSDPTTNGWFNEFILYPFDSSFNQASWYAPVISTNSDDIVAAVKSIPLSTCPGNGTCSTFCPRPYFGVLQNVLSMPQFANPNSLVLVITRSTPEDANLFNTQLSQTLQETRAQVNFILPAIDSPCSEGWNSQGVTPMYRAVQYSDGNLFVMSPGDVCNNFIAKYIPTLYKSAGLESAQLPTCGNSEILFQVEHEMYEFTIDYYMPLTNPPFVITLTDPAGDQIDLPPSIIISDSNYLGIVRVNDTGYTRAGTYRLAITGGTSQYCFLNIRGRSSIEIYPGFVGVNDGVGGATIDGAHYAPTLDQQNTIVVHAAGLNGGVLTYAQVVVESYGLVHTTNLLPRNSECSFEWYGNLPFNCDHSNLLLVVYGLDARGANFRRNYIVSGVSARPPTPPPPPPPSCDLSTVQQDVLFMIDSSLKNDQTIFNQLKLFASNSLTSFKIDPSFTQIGALTLADKAYGGFSFLAATSWMSVNSLINGLAYSNMTGQDTHSGFQYVIDKFESPNQGYRDDPNVRHNVVYLTATNPTDDDPAQLPYAIRRQGLYGISVIAYQLQPSDKLVGMVNEGCLYQANSLSDLNTYGTNFIHQLACSRRRFCGG